MSTAIYDRLAAEDPWGASRKAWSPTPHIIDVRDGGSEQCGPILSWCEDALGPESRPVVGEEGKWHRGCVTIHGWTWYGFATEGDMALFLDEWRHLTKDEATP